FDVQSARQVAEGVQPYPLASADRLAQLFAQLPCVATRPQWVQPPGPRVHRSCCEQKSWGRACLSAAGCEHAAVCDRSLSAQPKLRERRCRGQATSSAMADDG